MKGEGVLSLIHIKIKVGNKETAVNENSGDQIEVSLEKKEKRKRKELKVLAGMSEMHIKATV